MTGIIKRKDLDTDAYTESTPCEHEDNQKQSQQQIHPKQPSEGTNPVNMPISVMWPPEL